MIPNYAIYSDKELAQQLLQGEQGAFKELYNRYWQSLFNAVYKRLKDKALAKDIVQDVFLDLWNRRQNHLIADPKAFLHTEVRFQVYKKVSRLPPESAFFEAWDKFSTVTSDAILREKELLELLEAWMNTLPEKRRTVFILHYLEDLSTLEVSQQLNISLKTVQNQAGRAMQSLKLRLQQLLTTFF